jgi:ferric-dicitrate binding protein FerR (iron transport regulator)
MTAEENSVLHEISNRLNSIEERQETIRKENREDHAEVFRKIEEITKNGCPLGAQHSRDIKELKDRPERIVGIGAAIAAIIGAVVSWVK